MEAGVGAILKSESQVVWTMVSYMFLQTFVGLQKSFLIYIQLKFGQK